MRFCDGEVADAYWKNRIIESKVVKLGNSALDFELIDY